MFAYLITTWKYMYNLYHGWFLIWHNNTFIEILNVMEIIFKKVILALEDSVCDIVKPIGNHDFYECFKKNIYMFNLKSYPTSRNALPLIINALFHCEHH
jgi:hypothetical protein